MLDTSQSPMKIALFKSFFAGPVSGADETLVTYAIELQKTGHEVTVLLLFPFSEQDNYFLRLRAAGVEVRAIVERAWLFSMLQLARAVLTHILFPFVLLAHFPSHVRRLWQALLRLISGTYRDDCCAFLRSNRFDALHLLTPDSGTVVMIRAAREAGVPALYQELGTPDHVPALTSSYVQLAKVSRYCTWIAALSPKLARDWAERLPHAQPIEVLPLIVAQPPRWDFPRRPLPFELVFGFAGRVEEAKGAAILIEAFAAFDRTRGRALLRIAGVGPQSYAARSRCRSLGIDEKCDFVGHYGSTEGRAAFMQTLDIFVLPSFAEGTPNSVIEAMVAGVPIIATSVGGLPDIVTQECGILVAPGDPNALAEAMLRMARDAEMRARMGQAGAHRYRQLFAPDAVTPMLLRSYARLSQAELSGVSQTERRHPWEPEV